MERFTIRAFRAPDEPGTCTSYIREHRRVLEDVGVSTIVDADQGWKDNDQVIVLVVEHDRLGLVGGIRLHYSNSARGLPMTDAIEKTDGGFSIELDRLIVDQIGEIGGLWNSSKIAGLGLPTVLSMAAVSLASQVKVGTLACFVAHYTMRHARKVGFTVLDSVGKDGTFNYPIEGITSIAMVIEDSIGLESAMEPYRHRIISLRLRPAQEVIESPAGIPMLVRYILHPSKSVVRMDKYGQINHLRTIMMRA